MEVTESTDVDSPETMTAIVLTGFGGYEKIELQEIPKLTNPKDEHVIIQIRTCGMNFSDLYTRQGVYTFHGKKPPFILGLDGAGVIAEVGKNVPHFEVEHRVLFWKFDYGTWAEYVEVHHSQCFFMPNGMTYEEATTIVTNYVTAFFAIIDFGNLKPGQSVLIQSAAGGVGWAATQLAKIPGNTVIFGTASSSKHELIKENGVTHAIDYQKEDFVEEILKISPKGVNVILDCLSGDDFNRARTCLKSVGKIIHVGISSMIAGEKWNILKILKVWWQTKNIKIYDIIQKNHGVAGLSISNIFEEDPELFRMTVDAVVTLFEGDYIKPRIDSVWSFDDVIDATKHMVERKNVGKIVLVPYKEDNSKQTDNSSKELE